MPYVLPRKYEVGFILGKTPQFRWLGIILCSSGHFLHFFDMLAVVVWSRPHLKSVKVEKSAVCPTSFRTCYNSSFSKQIRTFPPSILSENPWETWVFKHFFANSTKIISYSKSACPTSFRENANSRLYGPKYGVLLIESVPNYV